MNSVQTNAGPTLFGEAVFERSTANPPGAAQTVPGRLGSLAPDALARGAWPARPADNGGNLGFLSGIPDNAYGGASGQGGGLLGLLGGLITQLGQLINQYAGESKAEGASTQSVADATFASTGDPHLSEMGTLIDGAGKTASIDRKFDSMTSHDNLLSSQDFNGGYRLSTTVTAPNANGVTLNANATVHANNGLDTVSLANDGTVSIASNGRSIALASNQSAVLDGGEQVARNADGSLTISDLDAYGGSITTTLTAKNGGVDVTAAVHNATVGGDIAAGTAADSAPSDPARRYAL